jgi:Tol biopolymer transport system component
MAISCRAAALVTLLTAACAGGVLLAPAVQAERPKDHGKIVFYKADLTVPTAQIYSMNIQGENQTNLSAAGGGANQVDLQPSLSPDGTQIAFVRLDLATFSAQIWTMLINGTDQTDISNDALVASESGPSWTEDGSGILFVKQASGSFPGAGGSIWVRRADGGGAPSQVTLGPADANPAMSPDGDLIAFSRPAKDGFRHLLVIKADGTGAPSDLGTGSKPDWSPDSTRLVYGQAGTGPIMVLQVSDPSNKQTLTAPFNEAPAWSPNGRQIVFMHCIGFNACQIALMSSTGQDQHDITSDPTLSNQHPDW